MKKTSKIFWGIFPKLSLSFVAIGLLPLLVISTFFLNKVTGEVNDIILNNAKMVLKSTSASVDAMLEEWEEKSYELYGKRAESGKTLGELVLDISMNREEKEAEIKSILAGFSDINGIKTIRFLDVNGHLYYLNLTNGKVVNMAVMEQWKKEEMKKDVNGHHLYVDASHEDTYFANVNNEVLTIRRNLFNAHKISTIHEYLGTVYIDISKDAIQQYTGIDLGERSGFFIIDDEGQEIYRSMNQNAFSNECGRQVISSIQKSENMMKDDEYYYLFQENQESGLVSVLRIHRDDILESIKSTRSFVLSILGISSFLLLVIYFLFSKKISVPIQHLKIGMEQVQNGNFDYRVMVESHDEVGILAEGLNQMASQLGTYIERVYIAEIRQREAELNELKSQIKPHYLYNTLDIIRMTAMGNDDRQAAEMIECLARQLRYLMGQEGDLVPLERELANVRDYFQLMRYRYENRIELKITVAESLYQEKVLKLILQPIVENAVKHGLKEKQGKGEVWINACLQGNVLQFMVMDNGVGIDGMKLEELQRKIEEGTSCIMDPENGGVGLVNVNERICNRYGKNYGIQVQSTPGTGTIVIISVPCEGEDQNVQSGVGG